jgi:hypothetical protein
VIDAGAFEGQLCFNLEVRMTTRDVLVSIVALAGLAAPAHATITYTYCDGGCTDNTGTKTYTDWRLAPGATGLAFSAPITFLAGGLDVNGVYTDAGTGTIFTAYSGASVDGQVAVLGTSLAQGNNGSNTGFEIKLPANTYAFSAFIGACFSGVCNNPGFALYAVGQGDHTSFGTNYGLTVLGGGASQFFGIVSDVPLNYLFISSSANYPKIGINSFEVGTAAADTSTPEVSTFLLIGSGLVLMRFLRRRQQRRQRTKRLDPVFS